MIVRKINQAGIALILHYEGFSATPYRCPAGVWTIGFGSTRTPQGKLVTQTTPPLDREMAMLWLEGGLRHAEQNILRLITAPLSPNQFSALVSFGYNVGSGNMAASTLRQCVNRLDYDKAAGEFLRWNKVAGRPLKGLTARRQQERLLFIGG